MGAPLWCEIREHWCRCHDYGPRCEDYDNEIMLDESFAQAEAHQLGGIHGRRDVEGV